MPDSKITALTALTSADPANDMFPIVDVSDTSMAASGTTKRISINNLLAASGTATLASATITGDLTVDTNVLKVDSANNRVGIGTATPSNSLDVIGTGAQTVRVGSSNGDLAILSMFSNGNATWSLASDSVYRVRRDSTEHHRIDATGIATWSNVGGVAGTAMTLNATGLLVGASASGNGEKLNANGTIVSSGQSIGGFAYNQGGFDYSTSTKNLRIYAGTSNATGSSMSFVVGTSTSFLTAMTLDASGNLFLGAAVATAQGRQEITFDGNTSQGLNIVDSSAAATSTAIGFIKNAGTRGNILVTATGTTYNTVSDYRLKESVKLISGGLARVNALKPSVYNWKSTGSTGEGFLAHELAEVVPAAVSGEKDALHADGSINAQSVDMSRIVPILVAAIQELTARLQTLEAR